MLEEAKAVEKLKKEDQRAELVVSNAVVHELKLLSSEIGLLVIIFCKRGGLGVVCRLEHHVQRKNTVAELVSRFS